MKNQYLRFFIHQKREPLIWVLFLFIQLVNNFLFHLKHTLIIVCALLISNISFANNKLCDSIFLANNTLFEQRISETFKIGSQLSKKTTQGLRFIDHATSYRYRPSEFLYSDKKQRYSTTAIRSFYNSIFKFLILVPLHKDLPYGLSPAGKVFKKLWQNPDYILTQSEELLLKSFKLPEILQSKNTSNNTLFEIFNLRKEFIHSHPNVIKFNQIQHRTAMIIWLAAVITIIDWFFESQNIDNTILDTDFIENKKNHLKENEVRIMNETVPFPHMAIEIDGIVYSYGQTHMSVATLRDYIQELRIRQAMDNNKTEETTLLQKSINMTGLNKLDRVVQTITLRLSLIEKDHLKKYLIQQTGKRYRNFTLAHDCASMIVKALKRSTSFSIPTLIDPSPSQVMMYFNLLKTLKVKNNQGDEIVSQFKQVHIIDAKDFQQHHLRSTYINAMDTRIYWTTIYFNLTIRFLIELFYKNSDQYFDQETLNYFQNQKIKWKLIFLEEKVNNQWGLFEKFAQESNSQLHEKIQLKNLINQYKQIEINKLEEYLNSPDTQLIQLFEYQTYKELIEIQSQKLFLCLDKKICQFN